MQHGLLERPGRTGSVDRIRPFLPLLRTLLLVVLAVALITIVFPALVAAQRAAF